MKQFDTRTAQADALATQVANELRQTLVQKDTAVMAVAGGSTPAEFFALLSKQDLDWANVIIMPSDERFVDETSDRSNARLIKTTLMINNAAAAQYCPMFANTDTPDAALRAIAGPIAAHLPLDICVLGMGADMHTASLFPDAPNIDALLADDAPDIMAVQPDSADEPRITLTAQALNTAAAVHILISGADKKAALERAQAMSNPADAPILSVLTHKNVDVYYAD